MCSKLTTLCWHSPTTGSWLPARSLNRHPCSFGAHVSLLVRVQPLEVLIASVAALGVALHRWAPQQRILMLGLGGGALTSHILARFERLRIDAVDCDERVIDVARRFFDLVADCERLTVRG